MLACPHLEEGGLGGIHAGGASRDVHVAGGDQVHTGGGANLHVGKSGEEEHGHMHGSMPKQAHASEDIIHGLPWVADTKDRPRAGH